MRGFERDKWISYKHVGDWKVFTHKDYPFIKLDFRKVQKSYSGQGPVWRVVMNHWSTTGAIPRMSVSFKRLTINQIPDVLDKIIVVDNNKKIIMDYLFQGEW